MRASTKLRRLIEGDDVIVARWSGGFMDDGEIVEAAAPDEFFGNPKNDRTKLFLRPILTH